MAAGCAGSGAGGGTGGSGGGGGAAPDYARACEENARLREENAAQAAELEELRAGLAVLQRKVFSQSSEKSGRSRLAVMAPAVMRAGTQEQPGRNAARGRGQGGGIIRACLVSGFSGISREAGTAARSAGCRHAAGRGARVGAVGLDGDRAGAGGCRRRYRRGCSCRVPATVTAPAAEGDREGPVHRRVHRDAADGAVRRGAEHELAGGRSFPAGAEISREFGGDVRAGGGAAGAAGGRDCGAVARVVALAADETAWRVSPRVTGPARRRRRSGCSSAGKPC